MRRPRPIDLVGTDAQVTVTSKFLKIAHERRKSQYTNTINLTMVIGNHGTQAFLEVVWSGTIHCSEKFFQQFVLLRTCVKQWNDVMVPYRNFQLARVTDHHSALLGMSEINEPCRPSSPEKIMFSMLKSPCTGPSRIGMQKFSGTPVTLLNHLNG